ncbi:MAG: DUF6152 family protein [Candidatus Acidiferrales bacterium]
MQRRPINFALAALAAGLLLVWAAPVGAHHSGAMFDMQHPITVTGVVTKVEWTNPHTYFYLNVTDEKGEIHEWAVEANSPNFLKHNGWTSTTVNPGDQIVCTGAPARNGSRFMHTTMVQLPSGLQLRS